MIWGDDVGQSNISAYTRGMMGYRTPNIDRIAKEGIIFTDYYGEQSCTAGRSSFIMGQSVFRTGLSKVGMPGADQGMQKEDPTIAGLLKDQSYATGQFGKNHLGDHDEMLPTMKTFFILSIALLTLVSNALADPLPSWNEGPNKKSIISFVERIATFDNDGCLWFEQPVYFQLIFIADQIKKLAPQHPGWKTTEPFASILKGDWAKIYPTAKK